jgi:hypothetical protein
MTCALTPNQGRRVVERWERPQWPTPLSGRSEPARARLLSDALAILEPPFNSRRATGGMWLERLLFQIRTATSSALGALVSLQG